MYHLISSHRDYLSPLMAYCKSELKGNGDKAISFRNSKHVLQIVFAYPDTAVGFVQTHFHYPYPFHGDTRLNQNTIQNLPPN